MKTELPEIGIAYAKMRKIINSCKTPYHVIACQHLVIHFNRVYRNEDMITLYRITLDDLLNHINNRLENVQQ